MTWNALVSIFTSKRVWVTAGALALLVFSPAAAEAAESESTAGTSSGYQTTVQRQTEGELSEENLRQVSLLGSQVLLHLSSASHELEAGSSQRAAKDVEKALTLVGVIRDMLPVTVETTVVKNPEGREIYRHTQRSQDDLIPIYEAMSAIEVVQPILDARWDRAAVEGVQLTDVDLVRTSVLADLGYIERRLRRAQAVLETSEEALEQIRMAQVRGVRFSVDKTDDPLLAAQRALLLAEKAAEDENYQAADANLLVARNQLTIYRELIPEEAAAVKDLQKQIRKLEGDLDEKSPGVIRGFWKQVTGWMSEEPGQATATAGDGDAGESAT